jgi:YtkA-like
MEENMHTLMAAIVAASILPTLATNSFASAKDYRFELAGTPQKEGHGANVVSVKVVHLPDNKPVTGAIIIQSRADMGPIGMAAMTAPVKSLPEQPPGTYRFEIQNGSVWKKPDNWALGFAAKVQGEPETVRGNIVVKLEP